MINYAQTEQLESLFLNMHFHVTVPSIIWFQIPWFSVVCVRFMCAYYSWYYMECFCIISASNSLFIASNYILAYKFVKIVN